MSEEAWKILRHLIDTLGGKLVRFEHGVAADGFQEWWFHVEEATVSVPTVVERQEP